MQAQITNAFTALNAKLIADDQRWGRTMCENRPAALEAAKARFETGDDTCARYYRNGNGSVRCFDIDLALIEYYGSKAMLSIMEGRTMADALALLEKNTTMLIERRDAKIIKALTKAGITEIPDFELVECSDGLEGLFVIAGKTVTIRTIIAGGYNIQRLHNRTLVKVK